MYMFNGLCSWHSINVHVTSAHGDQYNDYWLWHLIERVYHEYTDEVMIDDIANSQWIKWSLKLYQTYTCTCTCKWKITLSLFLLLFYLVLAFIINLGEITYMKKIKINIY